MTEGYAAVMRVAEHETSAYWLPIIRACHTFVVRQAPIDGMSPDRVEFHKQSLDALVGHKRFRLVDLRRYGVLAMARESTRGGARGHFRMPDPDGVGKALDDLNVAMTWAERLN